MLGSAFSLAEAAAAPVDGGGMKVEVAVELVQKSRLKPRGAATVAALIAMIVTGLSYNPVGDRKCNFQDEFLERQRRRR